MSEGYDPRLLGGASMPAEEPWTDRHVEPSAEEFEAIVQAAERILAAVGWEPDGERVDPESLRSSGSVLTSERCPACEGSGVCPDGCEPMTIEQYEAWLKGDPSGPPRRCGRCDAFGSCVACGHEEHGRPPRGTGYRRIGYVSTRGNFRLLISSDAEERVQTVASVRWEYLMRTIASRRDQDSLF